MESVWYKGKFRMTSTMFQVNTFKSIPTTIRLIPPFLCQSVAKNKKQKTDAEFS